MADRDAAFVGSIPEKYDRYLGPIYFHHYADDLAARLPVTPKMRVLEMACGTGILTERLVRRLGGQGTVVATDLNEPMIVYAQQKGFGDSGLEWRRADATKLPFEDTSFEAALCQFGLMFFPDKIAGLCEAFRVLKPGGHYLFSTWDSVEHNTIGKITHETVASFFPADPPQFYLVPFSLHDPALIRGWLDRGREPNGGSRGYRFDRRQSNLHRNYGAPARGSGRHQGDGGAKPHRQVWRSSHAVSASSVHLLSHSTVGLIATAPEPETREGARSHDPAVGAGSGGSPNRSSRNPPTRTP